MKYKALRNFTMGLGPKEEHKHVKKGEVHEIPEEYAEEHLNPLDQDEEHDPKVHKDHLVQETDESVTVAQKKEERKKKKLSKAEQKALESEEKKASKEEKKKE